jgi:hypothetical protein
MTNLTHKFFVHQVGHLLRLKEYVWIGECRVWSETGKDVEWICKEKSVSGMWSRLHSSPTATQPWPAGSEHTLMWWTFEFTCAKGCLKLSWVTDAERPIVRLSGEITTPSQTIGLAKANTTTITVSMGSIPRHPSNKNNCQQQQSLVQLKHPSSNPKQPIPLCIWWWKYHKTITQNTMCILFQKHGYMFQIESIHVSGHYTQPIAGIL